MRLSQPSNAVAERNCFNERQAAKKHLLRQVVAQARASAQVIHELAHTPLPPLDDLGKSARIARAGERDDERIGRLCEVGGR